MYSLYPSWHIKRITEKDMYAHVLSTRQEHDIVNQEIHK